MASLSSIARLSLGGLVLDQRAFQAQRDTPGSVVRGAVLVALVALLVAVAALIGDLGEALTQPEPALLSTTLYRGISAMPIYKELKTNEPAIAASFEQAFSQPEAFRLTPSLQSNLLTLVVSPLLALLIWLLGGAVVHLAARAFGGQGSFAQTMACTAVASGANLLGLAQVVPYSGAFPGGLLLASSLLGMLGTYVAVREAHGLPAWRSFWAVVLGPALLMIILFGLYCCVIFVFTNMFMTMGGGAGQ